MATFYVDGDNGSDGNSGLSEALAKATIGAAISASATKDTIYIQNNGSTVYAESAACPSGECRRFVGYGTTPGDDTIAVIDAAGQTYGISMTSLPNLANSAYGATNLEVKNATSHGIYTAHSSGSANDSLRYINLYVHDNGGKGIYDQGGAMTVGLVRVKATGNAGAGVDVYAANPIFCRISNNGAEGLKLNGSVATTAVGSLFNNNTTYGAYFVTNAVNCVAYGNGSDGMRLVGANSICTVMGSIFMNNGGYGAYLNVTSLPLFVNVGAAYYGNTSGKYNTTPIISVSESTSDPLFTNASGGDFSLQAGSPALQMALAVGPTGTTDISYLDAGALQIQSSSVVSALIRRYRRSA